MEPLKIRASGEQVRSWQLFLITQGLLPVGTADGIFGPKTEAATKQFQIRSGLVADGIVGPVTYAKADSLKAQPINKAPSDVPKSTTSDWNPPQPNFKPLVTDADRQKLFGKFAYKVKPDRFITITDDWATKNIVTVRIPQLIGIPCMGQPIKTGNVQFHRLAVEQLKSLFIAWERAGLIKLILTWEGSFVPRLVRGGDNLSNHAFGTAFDVNYNWNKLGDKPTNAGTKGSVKELVPIANQYGFYWGGHYSDRLDGMHFEVARLM